MYDAALKLVMKLCMELSLNIYGCDDECCCIYSEKLCKGCYKVAGGVLVVVGVVVFCFFCWFIKCVSYRACFGE